MNNQEERERFELFLERINKIKRNSLIIGNRLKQVQFKTHYEEGKGYWTELLDATGNLVNMESFDSLIVAFRLIYLKSEKISITKVIRGLLEFAPHNQKEIVQNFESRWESALREDSTLIDENGSFYPIKVILDNWLYGEVIHIDENKSGFVKQWGQRAEAEAVFVVNFLLQYVFWLSECVQKALDEKWV